MIEQTERAAKGLTLLLQRVVNVDEKESRTLIWSGVFFFCLLSAYYIIRPLRDVMGVAGGVWNIPWLFTGTFIATLICHPPWAALVTKLPRTRAISLTYRFFMLNILIFFVLLKVMPDEADIWIGRVFYIWSAVFSLFTVSVFWTFMTDTWSTVQGKRLFGFIGAGGTIGGIAGSGMTALLATRIGPVHLLLISIVLLELAVQAMRQISRMQREGGVRAIGEDIDSSEEEGSKPVGQPDSETEKPVGGRILSGITHLLASPYLLGICAYMLLYPIISTVLYMQQSNIAAIFYPDSTYQTVFFAELDLYVNILTLITQIFLTGRIIKGLGVGVTLALMPILCIIGFTSLGIWWVLPVFVMFQILRRAGNYALARPAREVLWTVVSREDKFKAKNFADTVVYRTGDQIGAWSQALLRALGFGMAGMAFSAIPVAVVWMGVALWLGRQQTRIAESRSAA
ncbi:NTP/NDP exchange transporter [Candidatus Zixiibacteriota bacterium]